jgi:diacylglycerol O-acyltransferase
VCRQRTTRCLPAYLGSVLIRDGFRSGAGGLDRLTPLDASNLRVEDHGLPMQVAALAIIDGASLRDATGRLALNRIREQVGRRARLAPRLCQVLCPAPPAGGPPAWVDDPGFEIGNHLRVRDLGDGADESTMLAVCCELNEKPLDRSRPLWEIWVLTGRADGNVALLIRLHHVVADGVASLDILGVLFDQSADAASPPASGQGPRPAPLAREMYADQLRRQAAAVSGALAGLRRPGALGRSLTTRLWQLRALTREGRTPQVSLNQPVGTHRTLILVRADLAGTRAAGHAHGATVNDVVLAALAGGARRLLQSRGELIPDLVLKVSVAASLRVAGAEVSGGNLVGIRLVPVPVSEPDAVQRLRQIAAFTGPQRSRPPYQPGGRLAQRWMVRVMFRQRLVNLLVSNLPGPPVRLCLAGAPVLEMFQVGAVQGNIALTVGVLSYAGQLNFDIVADADVIPDCAVFAEGLTAALQELGAISPGRPAVLRSQE